LLQTSIADCWNRYLHWEQQWLVGMLGYRLNEMETKFGGGKIEDFFFHLLWLERLVVGEVNESLYIRCFAVIFFWV
jgi:hypothetical protein